jgi:DNA mismatch repair ATPase MutS
MKAFLMYRDRDFGLTDDFPSNTADLTTKDLELDTVFHTMASGDTFLLEVARKGVLASLRNPQTILYRQEILKDCLNQSPIVREIYGIAVEAIERERKVWGWLLDKYPESTLHRSVEVLELFVELLKRLRRIADEHGAKFRSEGFTRLFEMFAEELDDEYLRTIEDHLHQLGLRHDILMSAGLGKGNKGIDYILHRRQETKQNWFTRVQNWLQQLAGKNDRDFTYEIADRDEAGFRALSELRNRGLSYVAAALGQSTNHILSFFRMLQMELGFYVACLNLREQLARKGEPSCFPEPSSLESPMLTCAGLYDVCLSLSMKDRAVGNDVIGDDKALVMITGANRGGKSTFLRSIGLAQLMMQCGMFVAAESFRANVCDGIFTHFKREEDDTMKSGKLDEELNRMSAIVDAITPHSVALLNESFASTNEREGSEIARQIIRALLEMKIKVFYVTHMFDLTHGFHLAKMDAALFLRVERLADGQRTYRLIEAEPLPTSYGQDLYQRVFGGIRDVTITAPSSI